MLVLVLVFRQSVRAVPLSGPQIRPTFCKKKTTHQNRQPVKASKASKVSKLQRQNEKNKNLKYAMAAEEKKEIDVKVDATGAK